MTVEKLAYWTFVTEEMLVDAGYEPPSGYWRRQEEQAIRSASFRYTPRWWLYRARAVWRGSRVRLGELVAGRRFAEDGE